MVLYFDHFLRSRSLLADGSNFIYWYKKLRETLIHNNILYVIEEGLGEEPGDSASEEEDEEFHQCRDIFIEVQTIMVICMVAELKVQFQHMEPYDMIDSIKAHFIDEIKYEQYKQLSKFHSLQMEEHTCLETHLKKMYDIYLKLTNVYDYWMADSCAIAAALASLPPRYEKHVRGYAIRRDTMTFFEFISQFRSVKVEPIEGEIFDAIGPDYHKYAKVYDVTVCK